MALVSRFLLIIMCGKILGIDEAGKNPLMGPMVVAGFLCDETQKEELAELGAKDSKAFGSGPKARERRRELARKLGEFGECSVQVVPAAEINDNKLNDLVFRAARVVLEELGTALLCVPTEGNTLRG